uniref:RING-type domain-containing protein n=1 Tax=Oreochromis aureus TaxID=47969 RepID=A0AAZ1XYD6_OREAU
SPTRSEKFTFLCSICLDVFTDPVSTPCGHNFCKTCISQHWDMNQSCQCPMCKETFYTRPQLRVNTFISLFFFLSTEKLFITHEMDNEHGQWLCNFRQSLLKGIRK